MKFNFQFSNLLGTVYRQGNILFTPDGNSVISPVGNKISVFNLKRNYSETLPFEDRSNFNRIALSPSGTILLASNDDGEIHMISLISKSILHTLRTNRTISDISFSPDGKFFAIAKENTVFVYKAPCVKTREFDPFVMVRVLKGAYDDVTTLTWTHCSRMLAVGSKDTSVRFYILNNEIVSARNFRSYTVGGHKEPIRAVFFEHESLMCYTICSKGQLSVFDNSIDFEEMLKNNDNEVSFIQQKQNANDDEGEDELPLEENKGIEGSLEEKSGQRASGESRFFYKRLARHFIKDNLPKDEQRTTELSSAGFHAQSHILVTGFSNGSFFIYEMPECNLIHSLAISEQSIASITLSPNGDWIAFGCLFIGQLLVWEWQSETFVMKQQGHFNNMACLSYSPDGMYVVTGGEDGKVKIWSSASGFSFVTFSEHVSAITGIIFTPNGRVVISSSLDGSVRAFDMARYRNFRTFTSPKPVQFNSVAVDSNGELIAAGGKDAYEIYLWSLKTGRLLEIVAGHEGPVSSIQFSPSPTSTMLVSSSWDGTIKIWNALSVSSSHETIELLSDVTVVAFRPDGNEVAVATLNGFITFFDVRNSAQTGQIESRKDIKSGRSKDDLITAKKSREGRSILSLCYSADGSSVLVGGQSKYICIYNVQEKLLIKKFEITQNRSFDAMDEVINRKKLTEFGKLVEDEDDPLGSQNIKLPGTKKGNMSRALHPEVQVSALQFSPTGEDFAATTTEGLLIYSLNSKMSFIPFELELEVTPAAIREKISSKDFNHAILMALKLNEEEIIRESFENVPRKEVELIARGIPDTYVLKAMRFVGNELLYTRHLHFYSLWSIALLRAYSGLMIRRSSEFMPVMSMTQKSLIKKSKDLASICDHNTYMMKYLLAMSKLKQTDNNFELIDRSKESSDQLLENDDTDSASYNPEEGLLSHWD